MEPITDYVLAILEVYPSVETLKVGQGAMPALDTDRLPAGVSAVEFGEVYCAGVDAEDVNVVLFRV